MHWYICQLHWTRSSYCQYDISSPYSWYLAKSIHGEDQISSYRYDHCLQRDPGENLSSHYWGHHNNRAPRDEVPY